MIAQLKYGTGMPFYRLEDLEQNLGIPLPASTQWEVVEVAAELIKPARDELIRQAARGEVMQSYAFSLQAAGGGGGRSGVSTYTVWTHKLGPKGNRWLSR
jgi:hypothetical protein